jgi:NAD(P)-dependent dehydrogenase (short-subunit alcohol dehydrogenase family)
VNVAGLWLPLRKYVDETEEMWDKMFGINAKGTGTAMRLAIQQFLKQDVDKVSGARGRIVNISSSAGITAIGGETTYAASKAAVVMLTRNAALDHAKDYINVNCVCPGVVKTGMSRSNWDNPETIKAMMAGTPWPRLGEPHDIAKVVNFLLSEDAQWMTGQTLAVDGGFTVGIPLAF